MYEPELVVAVVEFTGLAPIGNLRRRRRGGATLNVTVQRFTRFV